MHVIWKRPDGFHGAEPQDFISIEVGGRSKIWLHKSDKQHFPFRVSGGWQESESTMRLNSLINLVGSDDKSWVNCLAKIYDDTMKDDPKTFVSETSRWLDDLRNHLKGDTWEIDIMNQVLQTVSERITQVGKEFIAKVS